MSDLILPSNGKLVTFCVNSTLRFVNGFNNLVFSSDKQSYFVTVLNGDDQTINKFSIDDCQTVTGTYTISKSDPNQANWYSLQSNRDSTLFYTINSEGIPYPKIRIFNEDFTLVRSFTLTRSYASYNFNNNLFVADIGLFVWSSLSGRLVTFVQSESLCTEIIFDVLPSFYSLIYSSTSNKLVCINNNNTLSIYNFSSPNATLNKTISAVTYTTYTRFRGLAYINDLIFATLEVFTDNNSSWLRIWDYNGNLLYLYRVYVSSYSVANFYAMVLADNTIIFFIQDESSNYTYSHYTHYNLAHLVSMVGLTDTGILSDIEFSFNLTPPTPPAPPPPLGSGSGTREFNLIAQCIPDDLYNIIPPVIDMTEQPDGMNVKVMQDKSTIEIPDRNKPYRRGKKSTTMTLSDKLRLT